jgi:hypothetical protein
MMSMFRGLASSSFFSNSPSMSCSRAAKSEKSELRQMKSWF